MSIEAAAIRPATRAIRAALYGFGAVWVALGLVIATGVVKIGIEDTASRVVVGALLACDGGAFLVAGRVYFRRSRWADVLVAGLVLVNLVLTVTDDIGVPDVVAFVLLAALLALIVFEMRVSRTP